MGVGCMCDCWPHSCRVVVMAQLSAQQVCWTCNPLLLHLPFPIGTLRPPCCRRLQALAEQGRDAGGGSDDESTESEGRGEGSHPEPGAGRRRVPASSQLTHDRLSLRIERELSPVGALGELGGSVWGAARLWAAFRIPCFLCLSGFAYGSLSSTYRRILHHRLLALTGRPPCHSVDCPRLPRHWR